MNVVLESSISQQGPHVHVHFKRESPGGNHFGDRDDPEEDCLHCLPRPIQTLSSETSDVPSSASSFYRYPTTANSISISTTSVAAPSSSCIVIHNQNPMPVDINAA
ncbi:hypothetical protein HGRIS_001358 [Hohenbuehelia grisea]|uniref:Uncharacterized protein n=1 Tax=Hohenbuehelia grisea TaxID=104357 RepID=A0ABR3JP37_9AGAR